MNTDAITMLRRAGREIRRAGDASGDNADHHLVIAGFWLSLAKKAGASLQPGWTARLEEHAGISRTDCGELISRLNRWRWANRSGPQALKLLLLETATTGWRPQPDDSPAISDAMDTLLEAILTEEAQKDE